MSDQAEYKYDVFISYSHADRDWVWDELLPQLEAAGLKAIIDERDFEIGVPSLVNIERAVDNSRHILVVLTPAWLKSEWTEFESLLVGTDDPAARRRKLIPLMLEPCELPRRIAMLTYADFTNPSQRNAQMARLLKSIGSSGSPKLLKPQKKELSGTASKRRIDAAAPSHAQVGQRIDLLVQVRFPNSPLLHTEDWPTKQKPSVIEQASESVALEFPVDPITGKPGPARLEIRIVAPDFDIEGATQRLIEVPPDQDSKIVSFLLTATKAGTCRINVEVYSVDRVYLGTVPVETTVGATPMSPTVNVANLFLFVVVAAQEPLYPPAQPPPRPRTKPIPQILSARMWQGVAAIAGILAIIAMFVVPEVRQLVGLEQPTLIANVTSTITPTGTPAETPRLTPTSTATIIPAATGVSNSTDTPPPTSVSTSVIPPVTPSPTITDGAYVMTIFADENSLTVYVPADVPSSLNDLNLEYRMNGQEERYFFADSEGFVPYVDGTAPPPFCLHLERADSHVPFPLECQSVNRPFVRLPGGSVFWWDEFGQNTKTLFVNLGVDRRGVCAAGFSRCSVGIP